jgi:hypothetical protein
VALFLLIELGAWATAGDAFWARPPGHRRGDRGGQAVVTVVGTLAGLVVVAMSVPSTGSSRRLPGQPIARWLAPDDVVPTILVATALAVVAWLVADLRRRILTARHRHRPAVGGGWLPATVAASATALAVWPSGRRRRRRGAAAVVIAALLVLSGRPGDAHSP